MKKCSRCQTIYPDSAGFCSLDGAPLVAVAGLEPGTTIRRKYRIDGEIGRGGMGVVYKAWHIVFREARALKVINAQYAGEAQFVERFLVEALVTHGIQHPNIVRVEDTDETEDGCPFVAMEFVEGRSLRKLLAEEGPIEPARALYFASQVCAGLTAAHARGIIHRDIKPDNILVAEVQGTEVIKVLDFGIAKLKRGFGLTVAATPTTGSVFLGTPEYASPEQARGGREVQLDPCSDIYSLAVVLYEMLTGQLPFTGPSPMDLLLQHMQEPPPDPRAVRPDLDLPEAAVAIVMKALQKDRMARYASAEEMRLALERATHALRRRRQELPPTVVRPAAAPEARPQEAAEPTSSVTEYIKAARRELAAGNFTAAAAWVEKARGFDERRSEVLALEREIGERRAQWLRDQRVAELTELIHRATTAEELRQVRELLTEARREFGDDTRLIELERDLAKQERAAAEAALGLQAATVSTGAQTSPAPPTILSASSQPLRPSEAQALQQKPSVPLLRWVMFGSLVLVAVLAGWFFLFRKNPATLPSPQRTAGPAPSGISPTQSSQAEPQMRAEQAIWDQIKTSTDSLVFEDYLQKYPSGMYAALARSKLREFQAARLRADIERLIRSGELDKAQESVADLLKLLPDDAQALSWQKQIGEKREEDRVAAERAARIKQIGMEFVPIPAGRFWMGCSPGDSQCHGDENPRHEVEITKSFQLGKYEVTQEQWVKLMGSNPSYFKGDGRLPVEQVNWNDVQAFLSSLNAMNDGYLYRLPTEAEWEYAARGGTTGPYYGILNAIAWYDTNSGSKTHLVGEKQPNGYGLYDMIGNVWEWCSDWYGESYYGSSPQRNPQGPSGGQVRVLRGGSWNNNSRNTRVSNRNRNNPDNRNNNNGFRVCR
jgi:formylglycine-generating enzyme required for sulfatase activity/serine/threonine protein kinase